MRTRWLLSVFALSIACGQDAPDRVTLDDCERLREHVVALRMETVTADHAQHRAAIHLSLDPLVATCAESTTAEQLRCSLAAGDFRALANCNPGGKS
jgi:hypothetical protein